MARKKRVRKHADPVVEQLDQIKRLLMVQLVTSGVQAKAVAAVLGMDKSDFSKIVPARIVKKKGG